MSHFLHACSTDAPTGWPENPVVQRGDRHRVGDTMIYNCMIRTLHSRVHTIVKRSPVPSVSLHWFPCMIQIPCHPAVCRAGGSPPRISASPPQRCAPRWRRWGRRGCRGYTGCRCPGATSRLRGLPDRPPPPPLGSAAPPPGCPGLTRGQKDKEGHQPLHF